MLIHYKKIAGILISSIALIIMLLQPSTGLAEKKAPRVLIFTKMQGYVHKTLPGKLINLKQMLQQHHFEVFDTDDAAVFNSDSLKQYCAIVFLDCSGQLFDDSQKAAFINYMKQGGGWVGIHAAPIAEKQWDWYDALIGTRFAGHPWVQQGTVSVIDPKHPITKNLPASWKRSDEWYYWSKPLRDVHVLLEIGETRWHGPGIVESGTSAGPKAVLGSPQDTIAPHPIAWYHNYDGGRAFYTSMGHFEDAMKEPEMESLIINAINWVARLKINK